MNREQAKEILFLYRDGIDNANEPELVEALALAGQDPELGDWLKNYKATQEVLRDKFQSIPVPDGLSQQIVSEHAVSKWTNIIITRRQMVVTTALLLICLAVFYRWQHPSPPDAAGLAMYQDQMMKVMAYGYGMDLPTNDVSSIRQYLKQNGAPADFVLPESIKKAPVTGCAIESWQDGKVSLVCFHTGGTAASANTSDLWLFVADSKLVHSKDATPQFSRSSDFAVFTWKSEGKLYLLGWPGTPGDIKKYL